MSEVINNKFIVKSKLEFEEYKKAIQRIKRGKTIMTWSIYFSILILDVFSILVLHYEDIKKGSVSQMVDNTMTEVPIYIALLPSIFFLMVLTLIVIVSRFKFFHSIKTEYQTNPQLKKETEYIFTEEGVELVSDLLNKNISWNEFKKIKETKQLVLLFLSKNKVWIIPKNNFSKEELDIFRDISYYRKKIKN